MNGRAVALLDWLTLGIFVIMFTLLVFLTCYGIVARPDKVVLEAPHILGPCETLIPPSVDRVWYPAESADSGVGSGY